MGLAELQLEALRCLRQAQLTLHPRLNLICGGNGSGKTSLLEAVYLLGRGRSFRTRHTEQLIQHGAPQLWVFGRIEGSHTLGIRCSRKSGLEVRVDGQAATSLARLSEVFPVQVIDPGIHRLIEEGPVHRRRWLDWAVFHVEPTFVPHWLGFSRALRQRNAALKGDQDPTVWDGELVRLGDALTQSRARLIEGLQPYWSQTLQSLGAPPATLGFAPGWSREKPLAVCLAEHLSRDRERGTTCYGPHRFDVLLRWEGHAVRDVLSRGQQKLLGAAMALAMSQFVAQVVGSPPTLLLDDPAAELDRPHTEALLAAVARLRSQLIVTALHPEDTPLGAADRVFHVEQNGVKSV